jgi:hypothetical protein
MNSGRKLAAALMAAAAVFCAPAAAQAAVAVNVTGDDGNPLPLSTTAAPTIRNMDVKAAVHVDSAANAISYRWSLVDGAGVGAVTARSCWTSSVIPNDSASVTYRGNGTYTLVLELFSARNCTGTRTALTYKYTVAAGVALGQPGGPLMIRQANSFSTITQLFAFQQTPGAWGYEIKYAKGGVVQPDGSISAPALQDAYLDRTTGQVQVIGAREPGDYVMVARAKAGDFASPWSAPVSFKLMAPFDLATRRFPDTRGPRYQVRGEVREHSAAGSRVTLAIAKGKNGKRFRTLGKAKVNSKGIFKLRFTVRKRGTYRLRYSFSGNATVARGTVYESIRIRRILV